MRPTLWTTRRMMPVQFNALNDMQRQMDRLFGSLQGWEDQQTWTLPADVRETADSLEFTIEIPGLRPEDIDLTVEKDVLTVSGEKKFEREENEEGYRMTERRFGRFERSFRVPANADPNAVNATYEHGVLTVVLPKKEEAKPRRIEVRAGDGARHIESGA